MSFERNFKKTFVWMSKYWLPIFPIVLLGQAIYSQLNPWPPAQEALNRYSSYYHFQAGGSYSGNQYYWSKEKTYLLIDKRNYSSKTVSVSADSSKKVEVEVSDGGLFTLILYMVFIVGISGYVWFNEKTYNK